MMLTHDRRCDRDLCHPDCPIRKQRELNDEPWPGSKTEWRYDTRYGWWPRVTR